MTGEPSLMTLTPIAVVKNDIKQPGKHEWTELISEIIVDDRFALALDGLEDFSHVIVLFWLHCSSTGDVSLKVHLMRRSDLPLTGFFATRSPSRLNPIGLTAVRFLGRQGNSLKVQGLDAIDGTPVIDIKSYIPVPDFVPGAELPRWLNKEKP